ncbi:MAG: MFS transporter [Chloroflexi bacterium]|nr:MFS transporter [Chloroflexota bacterium]
MWAGQTELTASFAQREFRALWAAGAYSSIAQWTLLTARAALAYNLTGGSGSVGLVVFASMLPYVFVPPAGGVLADRFNRRTIMTCTLAVSLVTAVGMAVLTIAGVVAVWHLFALSLINGTARSIEMPAGQAMVPGLVPERKLLNAVALTGVVTHGSRLMGPLITLLLLEPLGAGWTFLAAAVLYLLGIAQMRRVTPPAQYVHPLGESPLRQLADGVRYSAMAPVVGMIIILVMFHCGLSMSYDALMPMYANDHIGDGDNAFSLLMVSVGAGSMAGTIALAAISSRWHRGRLLLLTGLLSGLSPAALALAMHWSPALLAAALMGASQATFMALTNAVLQTATPDRYRGRVLSLFLMIGGGVMAFGNLAAGYLGDAWGAEPVLLIPALAFAGIVLITISGQTLRGVYRREALPVAVH